MACGDKYAHLIRSTSGATADNPCPMPGPCTMANQEDWYPPFEAMAVRVRSRWADLRREELKINPNVPISDGLRTGVAADFEAQYRYAREKPFLPGTAVDAMVKALRLGACTLEKIDEGFASLAGAAPPPDPATPPDLPGPKPPHTDPEGSPDPAPTPVPASTPAPGRDMGARAVVIVAALLTLIWLASRRPGI